MPNKWQAPLKAGDSILIAGAVSAKAYFKKKDNGAELSARIEALELALYGRLTDLPLLSLVGRNADSAGPAQAIPAPLPESMGGLGTAPLPSAIYGSVGLSSKTKSGWAGVHIQGSTNYFMHNPLNGDIGFYDSTAVRWDWFATASNFLVGLPFQVTSASTPIKKVLSASMIISLESIPAGGYLRRTISLSGAVIGSWCQVSPTINDVTNGFWTFYCHAQVLTPDQVTLTFKNDWSGVLDLPDFWVRILLIEF